MNQTSPNLRNNVFGWLIILCLSLVGCKEDMKDLYQRAVKAYQTEDYQQAADLFEIILQKYPDQNLSLKARFELGNIYFYKLKQPENALKHLQELYAKSEPGTYALESLKLIGYIYDKSLNDCLKGVEAYRLILEQYASAVDAAEYRYNIGECYFKQHDYQQAMREFQALVDAFPDNSRAPMAGFQIANSYALLEQWEEAISRYQELLLLDTLTPQLRAEIMLELAFCYERVELFDLALKLYQELRQMDPAVAMLDTAVIDRKIERAKEALKDSQKAPAAVDWKKRLK
ncbi:TPR repeat protein [Candidatus Moduliflexus flocculans]|uniref:TPR repeat protein n=1 Tax=Candidatus Moduliflexus flocculans TaxID=1499966 RepID=A0A0S6VWJ8_9BACT|nr:TPR repeat protein [Candidatus Moduliflexus flocculans]